MAQRPDDASRERRRRARRLRRRAARAARWRAAWPRAAVAGLCFLSGVAGLTYEVIWLRLMAATLGNAATATAAVLAAVMAGFGLGGLLAGRLADRREPLKLYATLAISLGVVALALPTLASFVGELGVALLRGAGPGVGGDLVRFALAAAVLLVPASLMGATVPVLTRFGELRARGDDDPVGPSTGLFYGLNTAGAALGCALAGYLLLGTYGVRATGAMAATIDIGAGLTALLIAAVLGRRGEAPEVPPPAAPVEPPLPDGVVLGLAALSGACVLALEGLWTRLLLIVFGHDVHAFSSMLAVALVGLASGAGGYGLLPARLRRSGALLPALFGALGVLAVATMTLAGRAYLAAGLDVFGLGASFDVARTEEAALRLQPVFAALLVAPPALVAGAILPALCAAYRAESARRIGAGHRVGRVVAANTAGSILGSIAPMTLLIPALGLQRVVVTVGAAAVAGAVVLLLVSTAPRGLRALGAGLAIVTLALASAAAPRELPRRMLARKVGPRHLTFELYREGRTGTVAVVRNTINRERQLFVNGVNEVTTRLVHDQSFKLLGHLGLLLHPDPEDVLVICLGAGLSAGAAATHDVETLEIVDLERSVLEASERFAFENNHVLDDPRTRVIFQDGRHYLRTTEREYDVIVVDSTHPRAVDSWILYTREFYESASARLGDDGVLVQWLPMHGLSVDEFRIIVNTFLHTFPDGSLWVNAGWETYGQSGYALLVGARAGAYIRRDRLAERLELPRVRADLAPWGLGSLDELLECFVAGPEALRRWVGYLPINTDDHPITQFLTGYSHAAPMAPARLLEVRHPIDRMLLPPLDADDGELARALRLHYRTQGLVLADLPARAVTVCGDDCDKLPLFMVALESGAPYFRALRRLYRDDPALALEVAAGFERLGLEDEALETLEDALNLDRDDARLWLNVGLLQLGDSDPSTARRSFHAALTHEPDLVLARINLGLLEARMGNVREALADLQRAVESYPELAAAHAAYGFALLYTERRDQGERHLRRALALDPRHHDARINLGRHLLASNRVEAAVSVFRVGRRLYPYDSDMLYNYAVACLRTSRFDAAIGALRSALEVNPDDTEARALLDEARVRRRMTPETERR